MMGRRFAFGGFVLNSETGTLLLDGVPVSIGYRAFLLLTTFLGRPGEVLTKSDLMDAAWQGAAVEETNLTVQIASLRKQLGMSPGGGEWIATVPRVGYRFVGAVKRLADREDESTGASKEPESGPSIAVLPFVNISADPDQEYFADGIAEDIITSLSKLRWFFVIARNSTFAYKGKAPDVREVARDLGVRYVLEGSVRKAGDRLRVSAQLVDAVSGAHVWAERYDRPIADVFAVQDDITASVVAAIEPQLYAAEALRFQSKAPESLDAWGCVIRAMPYIWTWDAQSDDTALNLLKRATEIDPTYARAHSLLAFCFASRLNLGRGDEEREMALAFTTARRAIELDVEDPWAHLAAAYVHTMSRQFESAVEEFGEALTRNPNFALARMLLGAAYAYAGMVEDSFHHLELATRLSPRDNSQAANLSAMGFCHLIAGRFAEAVTFERRAVQLKPRFGTAWRTLAAAAGLAGDTAVATGALAEAKRMQPSLSPEWVEKYFPVVRAEDRARYIEGLRLAGLE